MGAFQSGFGLGQQAFNQAMSWRDRDNERSRQEKVDAQNAEHHNLRMRVGRLQAEEIEREQRERDGALLAATPQKAEDGFSVGGAGSRNFYRDEAQASAESENEAFIAGAGEPAVERATALTGGGAPRIAEPGAKADNSAPAVARRVADYWRGLGHQDKADQQELKAVMGAWQQESDPAKRRELGLRIQSLPGGSEALSEGMSNQERIRQAQLQSVTRVGLELIGAGDIQGLTDAYNQHYNDGRTAVYVPGVNGGGRIDIFQGDPSNGKRAGALEFSSLDDLSKKFFGIMNPVEALKARQAVDAAAAKGEAEVSAAYAKRLATNQADINSGLKTPGGAAPGVARGSRADKDPKPASEVVNDLIKEGMKYDEDPNAITRARSIASTAIRLNPGLAPERLAMAAQEAVTDPTTVAPRLDMSTGQVVVSHTSREDGTVTPLYSPPAGYKPSETEAAALRDDVRSYLKEEDARQPGAATMLMQAAKGNKSAIEALRNNAEQRLAAQIITARTRPDMSAKEKLDLNAFANQEAKRLAPKAMASYQNAIKLIQQYGQ